MTVVAVTMVKDEADIIESTVRHMCSQVDHVLVADNGSTDGTATVLALLLKEGLPLRVVHDPEVGYMQSFKMTRLAHQAHLRYGAHWIVPFDADEIWYSSWGTILDVLNDQPPEVDIVKANLFDHVCTGFDEEVKPDPVARIGWRRDVCAPLPKVACRYSPNLVIGMGNHEAWNDERPVVTSDQRLAIRHFPYRSPEQIIRKVRNGARAYAATDLPETYGAHWRQWGRILDEHGEEAIVELFHKWYWRKNPNVSLTIEGERQPPLMFDPAPVSISTR